MLAENIVCSAHSLILQVATARCQWASYLSRQDPVTLMPSGVALTFAFQAIHHPKLAVQWFVLSQA